MGDSLSIALVGCGRISKRHLDVIRELPSLRLIGVCDVIKDRADQAAKSSGVPAFYNHVEMCKALMPDVISVLVESGKHVSVACEVVPYVKKIIIEKPLALVLDDADRLIDTCENSGVGLFVVKQNRYNKPVVKLREALVAGRFGKLALGTVRVRWCRTQAYYDQDSWRGTWAMDGGVFANQASHHIDLLQWMMGPVESVQAYTATRLVDIETEDVGVAALRFSSGALGIIEATTATRPVDLEGSISILGEQGSVVISGFAVNKMETWKFAEPQAGDESIFESTVVPPNVYGFGHLEFYRDVLQCIQTGKRPMLDGLEGRKSLELIIAIYEAAQTRREIRLRYVPRQVLLGKK